VKQQTKEFTFTEAFRIKNNNKNFCSTSFGAEKSVSNEKTSRRQGTTKRHYGFHEPHIAIKLKKAIRKQRKLAEIY
jgi:hypothetical protein